jgi:hypothetical protein
MVVLETRAAAEARGAEVLGVLRGWGMSSDGQGEMVAPSSDGAKRAMEAALAHAELSTDAIGYINTHGTSTPAGDVSEVRAIRTVFNGRHVPYSSTKGYTGHTVSAAGAIEAIFTLAMLRDGWLAPSINAMPLDPELIDYPPVVEPTSRRLEHALSNSFGFGGTNVVLVLDAMTTRDIPGADQVIHALGRWPSFDAMWKSNPSTGLGADGAAVPRRSRQFTTWVRAKPDVVSGLFSCCGRVGMSVSARGYGAARHGTAERHRAPQTGRRNCATAVRILPFSR